MKCSPRFVFLLASLCLLLGCKEKLDKMLGRDDEPESAPAAETTLTPAPSTVATPPSSPPPPPPSPSAVPKTPAGPPQTKSEPAAGPFARQVAEMYPMPEFKPLLEIVDNWNDVPERAFPDYITVNVPSEYKLFVDGREIGSSTAPAAHKAKVLRFKPGQLLVTNQRDGSTRAIVAVEDTDFREQIEALYESKVGEVRNRVLQARRVAEKALAQTSEVSSSASAPGTSRGFNDGSAPEFKPVRDYLASGQFQSGRLEEAKQWLWLGRETYQGQSYDAVLVNFEVETLFGIFPNSVKALLQNGRVVKFIDAETGEERS